MTARTAGTVTPMWAGIDASPLALRVTAASAANSLIPVDVTTALRRGTSTYYDVLGSCKSSSGSSFFHGLPQQRTPLVVGSELVVFLCIGLRLRNARYRRSFRLRRAQASGPQASAQASAAQADAMHRMDSLAAALELAERAKDSEKAKELRAKLTEAEGKNPVLALEWRRLRRVSEALEMALFDAGQSVQLRLAAVKTLTELATPPAATPEAEEALHKVLREVNGSHAAAIRQACEQGLWSCWHSSGDPEIDTMLHLGMALMEKQEMREAVNVLSNVISAAPEYAEGWNQRATALYMLDEISRSIKDCSKVLELKPKHFGCLSGLGFCHAQRGDEREAVRWLKKALEVHPGLEGPRQMVDRFEVQSIMGIYLSPEITRVVDSLKRGSLWEPPKAVPGLQCDWDMYRVSTGGFDSAPKTYFFRVGITNNSSASFPVRSLARFYVLASTAGTVRPFTRLTEGASSFTLGPGEDYKFCWALTVGQELQRVAGGSLFEQQSDADHRFGTVGLESLSVADAPEVSKAELERLGPGCGYLFMGQLDLRNMLGL
eukprot:CAMPEP_0170595976 /NCGR_PEP_ID=MMETSP0224-20130122/14856_1 /TAXON_ID=285029 /ORGANISM="Togula jolla, Strain CCCM 725" /LENGTH=547 /DNA_ID=CAMNT_0010920207 /DNA_START=6 /DNA_END=1649 /DNA_ORIENTATION=-